MFSNPRKVYLKQSRFVLEPWACMYSRPSLYCICMGACMSAGIAEGVFAGVVASQMKKIKLM
jgi:hypothetical protein